MQYRPFGIAAALFDVIFKRFDGRYAGEVRLWAFNIREEFGHRFLRQEGLADVFHRSLVLFAAKVICTLVVFLHLIGPEWGRIQDAPLASKQRARRTRPMCDWHGGEI